MDALKSAEKIIQESACEQRKKKPRLKFNSGLALSFFFLKILFLFIQSNTHISSEYWSTRDITLILRCERRGKRLILIFGDLRVKFVGINFSGFKCC